MSNYNQISSFIWNVCDDVLRGLFKPHEYGDVILPFTVLRRLDCVLEPHKDDMFNIYEEYKSKVDDPTPIILNKINTTFFNHSKYDLNRLKSDPQNININFENYLGGYSDNVVDIIENFQLEKPVEKLNKNNRLFLLIDKFSEIDLHPSNISNRDMGIIFEELLRKFSEMSNETSGEHYTPRDVVRLLVSLVFSEDEEDLQGEGKVRSIFDPCCGTGGMLTIGKEYIHKNINDKVELRLLGQELNPQTYSVCKSDMLITNEDPDNIRGPISSLSDDKFQGEKFDYMITNPPFGVSWSSEREFVENESQNPNGRFPVGTPRVSDGTFLFLLHMISKMEENGSRIGIISNRSPLMTGNSGSGESEIRKWIIENDFIECIVSLPENLFFNTSQPTFIWILTNKKDKNRKDKIQLINGVDFFKPLKKNLNKKNCYVDEISLNKIVKVYDTFEENDYSLIFDSKSFGYTTITIEQPLVKNGKVIKDKIGRIKPDSKKRDNENIPFGVDINSHFEKWIKPTSPDSWIDESKNKIGYEIIFHKYFTFYEELVDSENYKSKINDLTNKLNSGLEDLLKQELFESRNLKDSEIELLLKIPNDWKSLRIKDILKQRKELSEEGVEKLLSVSEYKGIIPREELIKDDENLSRSESFVGYKKVYKGDLVNNIMLMWKRGLGFSDFEGIVSPSYSVFKLKDRKNYYKYWNFLLRTELYKTIFKQHSKGIIDSRLRLYDDVFSSLLTMSPPYEEQKIISNFLEKKIEQIDLITELLKVFGDVLNDYKLSLIEEVVFGKKTIK